MKISIITLFPKVFKPILSTSMMRKASEIKAAEFEIVNLRDFGEGERKTVDSRVYGGGPGMVLRADILSAALRKLKVKSAKCKVVLTSASGTPYKQKKAQELSKLDHLIIVCGHYEGVDQRFIDKYVDEEICIGDYVLTGGEIPAMLIADSVTRLLPNVLDEEATSNESFTENLLEGPQYTRPDNFEGKKVPEILLSGNHREINKWRIEQAEKKTKKVRPDLLK